MVARSNGAEISIKAPQWLLEFWEFSAIATAVMNIFAVYIVLTKTPKEMRVYKYFLLNILIWIYIADFLVSVIVRPISLFPLYGGFSAGILRDYCDLNWFLTLCIYFAVCNCSCSLVVCFFYRWWSMLPDMFILRENATTIKFCVVFHSSFAFPFTYALQFTRESKEVERMFLDKYYPDSPVNTLKCFIIYDPAINSLWWLLIASMLLILVLLLSMGFISLLNIIIILIRMRSHFSRQTYKLHVQLVIALVCQVSVPMVIYVAPICIALGSVFFEIQNIQNLTHILLAVFSIHSIINLSVMLVLVTAYRRAILRLLFGYNILGRLKYSSSTGPLVPSTNILSSQIL